MVLGIERPKSNLERFYEASIERPEPTETGRGGGGGGARNDLKERFARIHDSLPGSRRFARNDFKSRTVWQDASRPPSLETTSKNVSTATVDPRELFSTATDKSFFPFNSTISETKDTEHKVEVKGVGFHRLPLKDMLDKMTTFFNYPENLGCIYPYAGGAESCLDTFSGVFSGGKYCGREFGKVKKVFRHGNEYRISSPIVKGPVANAKTLVRTVFEVNRNAGENVILEAEFSGKSWKVTASSSSDSHFKYLDLVRDRVSGGKGLHRVSGGKVLLNKEKDGEVVLDNSFSSTLSWIKKTIERRNPVEGTKVRLYCSEKDKLSTYLCVTRPHRNTPVNFVVILSKEGRRDLELVQGRQTPQPQLLCPTTTTIPTNTTSQLRSTIATTTTTTLHF